MGRYNLIMKSVASSVLILALSLTAQTVPAEPAIGTLNRTLPPLATLAKNPDGDTFFGTALRKGEKCSGCMRPADFRQFMKISRQLVDDITSEADRYPHPFSACRRSKRTGSRRACSVDGEVSLVAASYAA